MTIVKWEPPLLSHLQPTTNPTSGIDWSRLEIMFPLSPIVSLPSPPTSLITAAELGLGHVAFDAQLPTSPSVDSPITGEDTGTSCSEATIQRSTITEEDAQLDSKDQKHGDVPQFVAAKLPLFRESEGITQPKNKPMSTRCT